MVKYFSIIALTIIVLMIGVNWVSAQSGNAPQPTCDPYQVGSSDFFVQSRDLNAAARSAVDANVMQDIGINPQVLMSIADNVVGIASNRAANANPLTDLVPAANAVVTPQGNRLPVYLGNCLESPVLAELPAGSHVIVLDGPLASEGFAWWRIRRANLTGWVIEGQGTEIWLQGTH